jgi:hypothetical protein
VATEFTDKVIAYVKAVGSANDDAPSVDLSFDESPVMRPFAEGLCICCSSTQGVRELRELIARTMPGDDHLISEKLYVRRDGKLMLLKPATDR